MKIIHRFSFPAKDSDSRNLLASLGIQLKEQVLVTTFEVDESDARWPSVETWGRSGGRPDFIRTTFTPAEINGASWLALVPSWHCGYPQPDEGNFGYRQATYDLADWCPACGTGMRQVAPFQMQQEPAWGKNSIVQLNWVFDEYFVTPELYRSVFQPSGIGMFPVLGPRGHELSTVVQLAVEERVPAATDGLAVRYCTECGRPKYLPVAKGMFPPLLGDPATAMAKTSEYFGSGGSAFQQVLISAEIWKSLKAMKVKGVAVIPVMHS